MFAIRKWQSERGLIRIHHLNDKEESENKLTFLKKLVCKKDMNFVELVQQSAARTIRGPELLSYEESLRELGLSSLEKSRLRRELTDVFKYLMERNKEKGVRTFSVMHSDRTRGNPHKWKHMKLHLNIWNCFFTMRMTKH